METNGWWLLRLLTLIAAVSIPTNSQPETNLLNIGCSLYNATNISDFSHNLNATLSELRSQLSGGGGRWFAMAKRASYLDPVYAMVQCRNYMMEGDCLACYDVAAAHIRSCAHANGARVIYDGCTLRYESRNFSDNGALPGNNQICGNQTTPHPSAFPAAAQALLQDLELATPRINNYYAAITRQVANGGNLTIYGMGQCVETISQTNCQDCLNQAYANAQECLPNADGRGIDAACFLRYSDKPFFAGNQTINIAPLLSVGGNSSNIKAIIGGVIGGAAFVLFCIAFFLWYHFSRKSKKCKPAGGIIFT